LEFIFERRRIPMLEENSSLHEGPTERKQYEAAIRDSEQRLRWLASIV
jgi:hypothetical protein